MDITRHNLRLPFGPSLRHGFERFWSWWIAELVDMLPSTMRRAFSSGQQSLFLEPDGASVVVSLGTAGSRERLAVYPLDPATAGPVKLPGVKNPGSSLREIVLYLPDDKVLSKTLKLPLAAEENLREVLSFEMDRQTPFRSDQVYYDFTVLLRNPRENTLTLELVLVPHKVVDELLAGLAGLELYPDRVTRKGNGQGKADTTINLLPTEQRPRKRVMLRRVNLALGALALALLLGAVSLPLVSKHRQIQSLQLLLDMAATRAEDARDLREAVDRLTADARFLVNRKQSSLSVLQIMEEVTRILPDDTWLNRLEIRGSEVQIQGQSSAAAALIPLIESSALLHNARFRSPVTRLTRSNIERFHLSAETQGGSR